MRTPKRDEGPGAPLPGSGGTLPHPPRRASLPAPGSSAGFEEPTRQVPDPLGELELEEPGAERTRSLAQRGGQGFEAERSLVAQEGEQRIRTRKSRARLLGGAPGTTRERPESLEDRLRREGGAGALLEERVGAQGEFVGEPAGDGEDLAPQLESQARRHQRPGSGRGLDDHHHLAEGRDQSVPDGKAPGLWPGAAGELGHQGTAGTDLATEAGMSFRIFDIESATEHGDGRTIRLRESGLMGGGIDADRETRHDQDALAGERSTEPLGHPQSVRTRPAGSDDRHRRPVGQMPANREHRRRQSQVEQRSGIVAIEARHDPGSQAPESGELRGRDGVGRARPLGEAAQGPPVETGKASLRTPRALQPAEGILPEPAHGSARKLGVSVPTDQQGSRIDRGSQSHVAERDGFPVATLAATRRVEGGKAQLYCPRRTARRDRARPSPRRAGTEVAMTSRPGLRLRWSGPILGVLVMLLGGCASHPRGSPAALQLRFGIEMAQRGLWREAAFRFDQARELEPGNPTVLNNLAVAYEALGRFEDAAATYQRALEVDPNNKLVRRNYTRFIEFYQAFRPRPRDSSSGQDRPGGGS